MARRVHCTVWPQKHPFIVSSASSDNLLIALWLPRLPLNNGCVGVGEKRQTEIPDYLLYPTTHRRGVYVLHLSAISSEAVDKQQGESLV